MPARAKSNSGFRAFVIETIDRFRADPDEAGSAQY